MFSRLFVYLSVRLWKNYRADCYETWRGGAETKKEHVRVLFCFKLSIVSQPVWEADSSLIVLSLGAFKDEKFDTDHMLKL